MRCGPTPARLRTTGLARPWSAFFERLGDRAHPSDKCIAVFEICRRSGSFLAFRLRVSWIRNANSSGR